ncbi:hypothetical protein HOY80DRAFT_1061535 [Tuber brumale]|nr:hypothetical protein HOY80DRAFT_1061535 [Tuber brumale]
MPDSQILSKSFDTAQTPPDGNSGWGSLIEGSKGPLKPFSSNNQLRRNRILLARGFSITFFAFVLLVICLWAFSKKHPMSKWEQRSFNTLSILLTAIASLGLGSLLGHLGSMLRWPLLARTVDSILGMSPPTGSLRLIWRHIRERRMSRTTFIVAAYLFTNVVGRLSVAIFGLSYNMTDKTGIEYPILVTNWTSASWTGRISSNGAADDRRNVSETFMNSAWSGLQKYAKRPYWVYSKNATGAGSFHIGDDISSYLPADLQVSNTTLNLTRNTVEYSYNLKDFQEGYAIPSNHTVHSAVNCSLIQIGERQYWRWVNGNRTGPFSWGNENEIEAVAETLRLSNKTEVRVVVGTRWMSFLDHLDGGGVYPQIYILCSNIAWECWPTLTETASDNESNQIQPHERFFHPTNLYRLLTVGNRGFAHRDDVGRSYWSSFNKSMSGTVTDSGMPFLCRPGLFESPNETVWSGYRLWVAGLVARLPIVAIAYANTDLPRFARGPHPNQTSGTAYLHTTLEVDWLRVALIAASITGGQILVALAVLCYCNGVYTRDDSHLATAELLKTVITRFDDGKLMTGGELASSLDGALKAPVSYGTRKGQDGGPPEVDVASGLDDKFPPFPPKRQFRRNTS